MRPEVLLDDMVKRLQTALGPKLDSVVLYGPEAHGDSYRAIGQLNLMLVLADLEPGTLRPLGEPVRWWLSKGQPWPRLFTRELIRDSLDVYPIEFLDIGRHHKILHGTDPLPPMRADRAHLRIQCERELREKLMRLREGYVEARGGARALRELLAASYPSFARIWRGCLHLLEVEVPVHDADVASRLCSALGLDVTAFNEVARIADGAAGPDAEATYLAYYRALNEMVARIDRLEIHGEGEQS